MNSLILLAASGLSFFIGFFYGIKAQNKPELFLIYLCTGLIFTSPLMIEKYTWFDELFLGGMLMFNYPKKMFQPKKLSEILFLLFCGYMLFEVFHGMLFFYKYGIEAVLNKTRWIIFFILILLIFLKISSKKIDINTLNKIPYRIVKAGLIFNIVYLIFGFISVYITGTTAFTQNAMLDDKFRSNTSPFLAIFGATGYVVSVYAFFIPAAFVVIKDKIARQEKVAWILLGLSFLAQLLYNSRSGLIAIIILFILFIIQNGYKIKIKRIALIFLLIIFSLAISLFFNENSLKVIFDDMLATIYLSDFNEQALKDIDRKVWNSSALLVLQDSNLFNFLFGYGLRSSGYICAPYVYDLFLEAQRFATFYEDVSTPGFAALAIDCGAVGLILTICIVSFCIIEIYKNSKKKQLFMLFSPILFFLQIFVMNILDVLLLYLAIMPNGLFVQMYKKTTPN